MDAGLIILYLIELVIVFVFGVVIFFKKRELDELNETCKYLRIKALSNAPIDREAIFKVIQEEGFFPTRREDGEIQFKIQGSTILAGECANGFCYLRMAYELGKESIPAGRLVANLVQKSIVAIKTIVYEDNEMVLFSVESYCNSTDSFRPFFQRALSILRDSTGLFWEEMEKASEQQTNQQGLMDTTISTPKESTILS